MPAQAGLSQIRPDRVCLIKPSSLGDVVHALPVLAALRELWPKAHLAWVVNRGLRGLLDGHPLLDEVIPFDRGSMSLSPRGIFRFGRFLGELRRRRFDVTMDLQGLLRSGLMTAATGAKIRVGLSDAREGASRFYTHRVMPNGDRPHAVDRLMAIVDAFGGNPSPKFVVAATPEDHVWAVKALMDVPSPRIVLNLGARWVTKRWPPRHFAEVARMAVEETGAGLVAVGSPEDRPLVEDLMTHLGPIPLLDLCGRTTLPQLAFIARLADVFLSNDTGPLHLAAAAGARTLGIYTCTSPAKTGPYGPGNAAISSQVWCSGSCVKTCLRMECMEELTAERVWGMVKTQLANTRYRSA